MLNKDNDCNVDKNTRKLKIPKDISLPFFAYDVFKPRQVAFSRIEDYIDKENSKWDKEVSYSLHLVNGVPYLFKSRDQYNRTQGSLIYFKREYAYEAYRIISNSKSYKMYKWDTIRDKYNNPKINVLVANKNYIKVKNPINAYSYDKTKDPMIIDVICTIWENIIPILENPINISNFLNLQMNYIFLWSAIDRYGILRYGKHDKKGNSKQFGNLRDLAEENFFKEAILKYADVHNKNPEVFSSEDFRSFKLDKTKSLCCMRYYYAIRCNVVHMGKSSTDDYHGLKYALIELLFIYMYVLRRTLNEDELFDEICYQYNLKTLYKYYKENRFLNYF